MAHSCNLAVENCLQNGALTCAAIMAPAPWAEAAVLTNPAIRERIEARGNRLVSYRDI